MNARTQGFSREHYTVAMINVIHDIGQLMLWLMGGMQIHSVVKLMTYGGYLSEQHKTGMFL